MKNFKFKTAVIIFTVLSTAAQAFAWDDPSSFELGNASSDDVSALAKELKTQYGINVSYIHAGNSDPNSLSQLKLKDNDAMVLLFGSIEHEPWGQDPYPVALKQLQKIKKALDQLRLKGKLKGPEVRGLDVVLFAKTFANDRANQLSIVNGYPIWACQTTAGYIAKGAKATTSKDFWNGFAENPTAAVVRGAFISVAGALDFVSCPPGDIIRDVGSRLGLMELSKRGIIFDSAESAKAISNKMRQMQRENDHPPAEAAPSGDSSTPLD